MKKYFLESLLLVLLLIVLFGIYHENKKPLGSSSNGYALQTITSGSVSLPPATSTIVSLPNNARAYAYLCNTDKVANDMLGFSNFTPTATNTATALGLATTTAGVVIQPQTCYTINQQNNTWAEINAITASTATTTLLYMFGQ